MSETRLIADRYELKEQIDAGGMGDVYRAVDTQTQTTVAVKVLKPQVIAQDSTLVDRFMREANALRKLNHPNIVRVIDTFEENHRHYIVMEYMAGGSLAQLIAREGQLPLERAVQIGLDLADALTRTHRLGIIHRDLKPGNVLLAADGSPRLTDFGVAHVGDGQTLLTQAGSIIGTIAYLSPEACEGKPHDERSDIWAFGIIMYEMLAGRHPFAEEKAAAEMLNAILNIPIPDLLDFRPDTPLKLRDLVHGMLTKSAENRIASARTVGAELEVVLNQLHADQTPAVSRFTPLPMTTPTTMSPLPQSSPSLPSALSNVARRVTEPRVFVAYRREDSGDLATKLVDKLSAAFGDNNVVHDVDRIADRTVSRFVLANDVVGSVDVVLVLIGSQWAGVPGRRTIDNPKDTVRIQVEAGLKRPHILMIPVLVGGAVLPTDLPPSMQGLADLTPFTLTEDDLDGQSRHLIQHIHRHFGLRSRRPLLLLILLLVALLIALLIAGGAFVMTRMNQPPVTVEPVAAGQYMILVADLEPVRTSSRDVSRFIADDLTQQLQNNVASSPIRIRHLPSVITSADQAQSAASTNGATVIVWGSYTDSAIDLQVQSGVTTAFAMQMERDPVDRLATMRVHLTDERQQSVAPMVLTVLTLLHNAEGDAFELLRTLTILSQIDAPPAEIVGTNAGVLNYKALQSFLSDPQQAINQLNSAVTLDGANPLLYLFRATAYQRLGDETSALRDIGTAQKLGGSSWTSPYYLLGNDAVQKGNYDDAIADFTRIINARPNDWFPPTFRGGLYYLKGDYADAKTDLDRAIALHPNANFPYPIATLIALREGRISDARQYMHTVLTDFPDPTAATRIIEAIYGDQNALIWGPIYSAFTNQVIGQYQNVVRDTQAALALDSHISDLYVMQGFAYCNLHEYPEAETAYTQGLSIEPGYPLLFLLRAEVRKDQNNVVGALADAAAARQANLSAEFNALLDDQTTTCENFWGAS
ncbi:MAG: protein kinase [Chloroflexi bacterium]|nr:protein kinase [Chloroflexota bacterium]